MATEKISWYGPEHFYKEKNGDWYWAVSIISIALIASAVLLKNYIFAIFIGVAIFTLVIFAHKKPKNIKITINEKGIVFEHYFYPFESIDSFYIDGEIGKIIFKSKKILMPLIVLPLEKNDPEKIRKILSEHIAEEEIHESLFQKILENLGF